MRATSDAFVFIESPTLMTPKQAGAPAAKEIVEAKNQALRNSQLNLQLAKAYPAGSTSGVATIQGFS
jgi:hypothetical protein